MPAFESRLIGHSAEFLRVLNTARLIANTQANVLIVGESGTGKECFAEAMHAHGSRAGKPFVTLNCAAIPDNLIEAELFGYRKGAFTGATSDQRGHIAAADGGTLFLDEVGELSLMAQGKLLRFLESQQIQPLGGGELRQVNVRVIAATNRDLHQDVRDKRFREDLYYRLNVVPLNIPPLRERREDVTEMLDHFTADFARRHGVRAPAYTPAARKRLKGHSWPGNVRELRNLCERMVVLFQGREIDVADLPTEIHAPASHAVSRLFQLPATGIDLNALEADVLGQAMAMASGNRSGAARLLGISRDTLLYRLKKYELD
ncbi:MAG: sigma-54-dependent Fis family transcriptional regulator [Chromatiales bacterium]|nr:sigma-54-dependent Fis family transcriptional regulator [Gammaproteobacteria bacterium]MCP5230946.1 sigma-54-dependent Fis family transcriptional regulator [Zoogloeaceae bacterium]MCP5351593.1 sigma-54-dependent Fis family transcriptional regulator [Chromatiales bacterium]